jgi:hypothetical protein
LASIALNFDETALTSRNGSTAENNGTLYASPLEFSITANQEETVFSKALDLGSEFSNRTIHTLKETGGDIDVTGQNVTLYQEMQRLEEQGEGLILSSERTIGSSSTIDTNLIRSGDTITAESHWLNVGNTDTNNITISSYTNTNAELVKGRFHLSDTNESVETTNLKSGSFVEGTFDESAREEAKLVADIKITGEAGNVVDLADGILTLQNNKTKTFINEEGSKNLITYGGDLNYDGRVSRRDLAYLNAGAALAKNGGDVAADVDANFDNKIDLNDLSVLNEDWGKTLHDGHEKFLGSSQDLNWESLDKQDGSTWVNTAFKEQNAFEAQKNIFEGSLEGFDTPTGGGNMVEADGRLADGSVYDPNQNNGVTDVS